MYLPLKEVCELPLGLAGELVREPGSCCTLWRTSRYVETFITYVLMFFSLSIHNRQDGCLTLELRMSHICDVRRRALSAAVAFLRQSSQVTLSVRS